MRQFGAKILAWLLFTLGTLLLCWLMVSSGLVHPYELVSWDWRLRRLAEQSNAARNIKIIEIDQDSLNYFASNKEIGHFWPWPRSLNCQILDFLKEGGAKAVAFDMIYTETSTHEVFDDQAFGNCLSVLPSVVGIVLQNIGAPLETEQVQVLSSSVKEIANFHTLPHMKSFRSATLPVPELIPGAAILGNVSALPDPDGILRRANPGASLFLSSDRTLAIPSLPFALYTLGYGEFPNLDPDLFDQDRMLNVRFYGAPRTFPTYRFADVYWSMIQINEGKKPTLNPRVFKDALVFVGPTAAGLDDLKGTPVSNIFPGVEYNATILSNIIQKDFILNAKPLYTMLFMVCFGLLASATCIFVTRSLLAILLLSLWGLMMIWISMLAARNGIWLPFAAPVFSAAVVSIAALAYQYGTEGRHRRFLRDAFMHYVSEDVVSQIVANPSSLTLGGQKRELTIFFSDIEGFTKLSERMEATKLVSLLNQFLNSMSEIIIRHDGTLDKYVGDAIVAFWNAPLDVPNHAKRAVQAALECQRELVKLKTVFQMRFEVEVKMRIGLHTGMVNVGNFGSDKRFNYTIIGDSANLAARLESANKYFGTYTLISEDTYNKLPSLEGIREVGLIRVLGRDTPVRIFEPRIEPLEGIEVYNKALSAYTSSDWDTAEKLFASLPNDPVSQKYLERIFKYKDQTVRDPVWNLSEK